MVNGNYVLYGDRPSSESETVDDHVQTRTAERKTKRKSNRTSKDSHNHKIAELDNETDAVKYEKKIKEPRLLRYVPTTDVEENYITEKFETYDLKPTEELPRRHAFMKKPKNPADGSVNYAYSRSSSSCSSPNLPTISEHGEQYGTYRVRSSLTPPISNPITGYETKLDKYFAKPREVKTFAAKVGYDGSHPDSLYRVPSDSANGADKFMRGVRFLRWPLALFTVCVALAVFVYFLMPVNMNTNSDTVNATYWEEGISQAQSHTDRNRIKDEHNKGTEKSRARGTKTPEIDFYDPDNGENNDLTTLIDMITERSQKRKLPIPPVFPTHISPEVQYGNERVDSDKTRSPKILKDATTVSSDSTLKPHITQKPEKPLAVYFKDGDGLTTTSTSAVPTAENFANAETSNDIIAYVKLQTSKNGSPEIQINEVPSSTISSLPDTEQSKYVKQNFNAESNLPPELQEFYNRPVIDNGGKFTSGHSKLFGISIEDAENMKSTTQNSIYNTRVSPTLPTWRNRDDATTKKYPISGYYDVPQCRSTRLPLCRGVLPYDLATGSASIGDVDVTTLIPQIEYLVSTNCSERVRHFACALLEPECSPPPYSQKLPCYNFCKAIVDHCDSLIPRELQAMFSCSQYSSNNCASARTPCYSRELACGDGTCVPRDWICDGTRDCVGGEDEAPCSKCEDNEYRCSSGMCITKRWLCDGYADCPSGEDEHKELCQGRRLVSFQREEDIDEPGEESAGSAPALSVRKPNRLPFVYDRIHGNRNGENDNSKELLMTSDSNNAFRRNFTRRPSPSRLTPYKRPKPLDVKPDGDELLAVEEKLKSSVITQAKKPMNSTNNANTKQKEDKQDSVEDVDLEGLELFEDIEKVKPNDKDKSDDKEKSEEKEKSENVEKKHVPRQNVRKQINRLKPIDAPPNNSAPTRMDKTRNKLERVIDGASMLRKAAQAQREVILDSSETNSTMSDKTEELSPSGYNSAHVSPCPSGELRCVDGRCITLAQLCDGTIDCSDHADEDNCYT